MNINVNIPPAVMDQIRVCYVRNNPSPSIKENPDDCLALEWAIDVLTRTGGRLVIDHERNLRLEWI